MYYTDKRANKFLPYFLLGNLPNKNVILMNQTKIAFHITMSNRIFSAVWNNLTLKMLSPPSINISLVSTNYFAHKLSSIAPTPFIQRISLYYLNSSPRSEQNQFIS